MKTYIFFFVFIFMVIPASFAAQDDSYVQMNTTHTAMYTVALGQLETLQKEQSKTLSWKEKIALKIATKKLAKAERKIKQGKKANFLGGLIALIIVGVILIPLGIFILLPLLIVGIVLLALGIVGSVFRGLGSIFW